MHGTVSWLSVHTFMTRSTDTDAAFLSFFYSSLMHVTVDSDVFIRDGAVLIMRHTDTLILIVSPCYFFAD